MPKQLISLKKVFSADPDAWTDKDRDFNKVSSSNELLFNKLFVDDSNYKLISSTPKAFSAIHKNDFGENFYLSEVEMDYYISGFIDSVKENVDKVIEKSASDGKEDDLNKAALDDADVKLNLYRSFKSLYDKWISRSEKGSTSGYFFNSYGEDKDERMLYDHFKFINRANQDVGAKAAIDFTYLSNLANTKNGQGPTQSLYQSLTELLGKNNFDFWPLPADINLSTQSSSDEDVKDIFKALDFVTPLKPSPMFVCVYVGGSSRSLADLNGKGNNCFLQKDDFNYVDDSFDLTDKTDWPDEYLASDDNGLVIFKVRYGQEAQNHFYGLQLDQSEFKETQESLQIIDAITNPKTGSQPSQAGKGNNMYDVYLTRSYNCTVSALGNMSIQPLMYFKLENVPMFRGTYLIKDVKHTITPHNIKTEFTGMRQPRVTVPLVTDAISLLDLSLIDVEETSATGGNVVSSETINEGFDTNVDVGQYKDVPDYDLFLYLSWQQGASGAAQHYSLWKNNGRYKKYNIGVDNIAGNWPSGYVSSSGVKASDVRTLYNTDQKKLAEAFIDVQRQLYNVKKTEGLKKLNSDESNRTGIKYSEIKNIFNQNAQPDQGLTYEALATFGFIENALNSDTKDTKTFKGMFQINKDTFSDILDNLSPKKGHETGWTDWVPLNLYVQLCVPRILKNFKTFATDANFGS